MGTSLSREEWCLQDCVSFCFNVTIYKTSPSPREPWLIYEEKPIKTNKNMRKGILFLVVALMSLITFTSCTDEENALPELKYDLEFRAAGEGHLEVGFLNNGMLTLDGKAEAIATISNDTNLLLKAPNGALDYKTVLANTDAYTKEEVAGATKVDSAMTNGLYYNAATGTWVASAKGYVSYGNIIFAIDETWPKDTTSTDSVAVPS